MKEILFIINPHSRRGATLRSWSGARQELASLGINVSEHLTRHPGDATSVTRQAVSNGIGCVAAVGGDGTVNEVLNGYLDEGGRPIDRAAALAILPSGTGSDFCRSLGIRSARDTILALAASKTRLLDAALVEFQDKAGAVRSRCFINVASFGLGGEVVAIVNQWRNWMPRWVGGRVSFIAAAVRALDRYKNVKMQITLDGGPVVEVSSNLIIVANGQFAGGGMMLAPHAQLDDGLLDIILTDRTTRFDVIKELPRIQRGGYLKNPKVRAAQAGNISIMTREPVAIDIDGEFSGFTPARITILPSAVRFVA